MAAGKLGERLVFASRRPPFPLESGARIRTHRLLTGLSRVFDTSFITFEHHPASPDGHCGRQQLQELLPDVEVVTVAGLGPRKREQQVRSLAQSRSWAFGRYRLPQFRRALLSLVDRLRPAVVHFDDLGVAQWGPLAGTFSVYSSHNVEYDILRQEAQAESGFRQAFATIEWRKLRWEEQRAWQWMPLCLAVSARDAETMMTAGARRVEVCPNGTDGVARLPPPRRRAHEPLRLLFVGTGSYRPNERGLAWFVTDVLSQLRAVTPVRLAVVGEPPSRPIEVPEVDYVGAVPSLAPWYERSHAVIVPLFQGSGTRLKVLEAMAYGRPVVSTALGAEGLPVGADTHYLQADDAQAFSRALASVATQCQEGDSGLDGMLERARTAVEPLFWDKIVERLVQLYRSKTRGVAS